LYSLFRGVVVMNVFVKKGMQAEGLINKSNNSSRLWSLFYGTLYASKFGVCKESCLKYNLRVKSTINNDGLRNFLLWWMSNG
jgi:hypothetical protein